MNVTLYTAAQIINEMFKANDIEKTIKPQMLYNYNNKGRLGVETTIENDKIVVSLENVKALYDRFSTNTTQSRVNAKALAAEILQNM